MSTDLLTPLEAARILGRSAAYLANMRTYGRGPKYVRVKEGRRVFVRYRLSDLKSYSTQKGA
jgi:hypothetical protein